MSGTTTSKRGRRNLAGRLRLGVDTARTMWSAGLFKRPRSLMAQLRNRGAMQRMQRAFFYQRFATATLLGRELGVYDALRCAPQTTVEIARNCQLLPEAADSLLRILESQGFVWRKGSHYQLSEFGELYLTSGGSESLAATLDLLAAHASSFDEICAGMRDGSVPAKLDVFSEAGNYMAFLDAVNSYLSWAAIELLRKVELPPIESFIVGSMGVSFSARVLQRFPDARVTYGCLSHLVREIPRLRKTYQVPPDRVAGMHDHGGDPAQDTWGDESFDLVLLTKKMILEPEQRIGEKFATKALEVLRPGGVTILWETVHADCGPTALPIAMEAVLDLGASPAAAANSMQSIGAMLAAIGYVEVETVACLGGQTTFVVARKAS